MDQDEGVASGLELVLVWGLAWGAGLALGMAAHQAAVWALDLVWFLVESLDQGAAWASASGMDLAGASVSVRPDQDL